MRLLSALVAALLLAGCSGSDPAPSAAVVPASATTSAAPVAPPPPAIVTGACEATSGLSYGALGLTYNSLEPAECPFATAQAGDLSGFAAALIEVVWTPANAAMTGAGLLVESDTCHSRATVDASGYHQEQCNHGLARSATSPMVLALGSDVLAAAGAHNLTVTVLPEGASASQAFTIHVTLFEAVPPPGYTAVP
jgi:hypothetical protein